VQGPTVAEDAAVNRRSVIDDAHLIKLYANGYSKHEAAVRMGVSLPTLAKHSIRLGLEWENRGAMPRSKMADLRVKS
jgi:transposase